MPAMTTKLIAQTDSRAGVLYRKAKMQPQDSQPKGLLCMRCHLAEDHRAKRVRHTTPFRPGSSSTLCEIKELMLDLHQGGRMICDRCPNRGKSVR